MKNKNYFNIIFVAAMIFNTAVVYSQTNSPLERRSLNSLTDTELLTLRNAIILYLNNSTAIADHLNAPDAADNHSSGFFDWGQNFLSWHRTYIQGLETYLAVNGYSQFVPLPKWNPSNPIPAQFQGNNGVADPSLYDTIVGVEAPVTSSSQWDRTFDNQSQLRDFCCGNQGTCIDPSGPFRDFSRGLEVFHNQVHGSVGGVMVTMNSPAAAIFWPWHAWIDDVYEQWRCICNDDNHDYFGPNEEWDDFDRTVTSISNNEDTYSAFRNLSTSGLMVMPPDRNITFRSGTLIVLEPGFSTDNGAIFTAYIDGCPRLGDQTRMASSDTPSSNDNIDSVVQTKSSQNLQQNNTTTKEDISAIAIFPNPNNGSFTLTLTSTKQLPANIFVYNPLGTIIYQENASNSSTLNIDISGQSAGI